MPVQLVTRGQSVRDQVGAEEWTARVELAAGYRVLAHYGVNDLTYNHFGLRVPGKAGPVFESSAKRRKVQGLAFDLGGASLEGGGVAVLVNTSFNVRGEPIVCTAEDAYRCFMATAMDYLVLGNHLLDRRRQPQAHALTEGAVREFEAD